MGRRTRRCRRPRVLPTYFFYAISLFGAAVVPYQVQFFSSGGREQRWSEKSILDMRLNAIVGFPLGGVLSLAIMAAAVPVLQPLNVDVSHLGEVAADRARPADRWAAGYVVARDRPADAPIGRAVPEPHTVRTGQRDHVRAGR